MKISRFILTLFALGLLNSCAVSSVADKPNPLPSLKLQENAFDKAKHLELKAFLNQHGTVSLRINNHSAFNVDNIRVALRLRYSARIVSNTEFTVPQGVNAGQSLEVDTEIPLPTERSIIRAQVIKAEVAP